MSAPTSRKIKIAYPILGDTLGGAYFSMLELTENLSDQFEREIILHEDSVMRPYLEERKIPYVMLDKLTNKRRDGRRRWGAKPRTFFSLVLPLARYIRDNGIDIVHTQTNAMHRSWTAAAKLAGRPHVWHQRTGGLPKGWECRLPTVVICVSDFVNEDVRAAFPGKRLITKYNPFAPDQYINQNRDAARRDLLEELGLNSDTKIVGFVSNVHPRKRPKLFIDSAHYILQHTDTPVAFVLFGGDRSGYVREVLQYAEEKQVRLHYLGFRSPPQKNLAALDVHVGCSVDEGYGRSFVETGLIGTPMILTQSGSNGEIVQDRISGRLVPPDDAEALGAAVIDALSSPEDAAQWASNCQKTLCERHHLGRYVSEFEDLYSELVK
ncbi:glycosyltransferase [Breoghania sp.]|uniref:glycosyltransferase n=1 Tax=Breoghania sp. TaxID=2065378 RepID=UPI002AA779D5|nr:glycosyltransferase [Breoghania sp.]